LHREIVNTTRARDFFSSLLEPDTPANVPFSERGRDVRAPSGELAW